MPDDPHATIGGEIHFHGDGRPIILACASCGATRCHQIRGGIGDVPQITCAHGHDIPFPGFADPVTFMMDVIQAGAEVMLPPE
ncbi:hypothetical protein ACWERV_16920 [Streptomyces sp. NPDC004031]